VKTLPHYRIEGKIESPLTLDDFKEGMEQGKFVQPEHRAYCILLYYSAVRKTEGLLVEREQFQITRSAIMYDVGERFKHSAKTASLKLPLKTPYMEELRIVVEKTLKGQRVFPYCEKTAYNIVRRAFKYPHLFRLSRITNFFLDGWTIAQVRSWTGLSLAALEYYVGLVDISRMGDSLAKVK
jgi:hypothetical protein